MRAPSVCFFDTLACTSLQQCHKTQDDHLVLSLWYLNCLKDGLIKYGVHIIIGITSWHQGCHSPCIQLTAILAWDSLPNDHNKDAASTERAVPHIYWCGTRIAPWWSLQNAVLLSCISWVSWAMTHGALIYSDNKHNHFVGWNHVESCVCPTYGLPFLLMLVVALRSRWRW
jgi:hypothetical protein